MAERDRDPGSLNRALEDLKAHVEASGAPAELWTRLAERAGAPPRGAGRGWWLALAAAASCLVAVGAGLAWWRLRPAELAGFELASASADLRTHAERGVLAIVAGQAWLRVPALGVELAVPGQARLRREGQGVRVLEGTATFEVARRTRHRLMVYVSGGRIEVLGTRFTVVQGDGAGEVSLERGSIRFVDPAGKETVLAPGERLRWPPAPEVEPPARPTAPVGAAPGAPPAPPRRAAPEEAPPSPAPPPPAVVLPPAEAAAQEQRRVLAEIDRLRIRREDELLVRRLDEILAEPVAEPLRERLSFERCDVLAHEAGGDVRACAEIARHLSAYPGGEYTARLESLRRSLGCRP